MNYLLIIVILSFHIFLMWNRETRKRFHQSKFFSIFLFFNSGLYKYLLWFIITFIESINSWFFMSFDASPLQPQAVFEKKKRNRIFLMLTYFNQNQAKILFTCLLQLKIWNKEENKDFSMWLNFMQWVSCIISYKNSMARMIEWMTLNNANNRKKMFHFLFVLYEIWWAKIFKDFAIIFRLFLQQSNKKNFMKTFQFHKTNYTNIMGRKKWNAVQNTTN